MADPNPIGAFNQPSPDLNALIQNLLAGGDSSGVTIPGQGTASTAVAPIAPPVVAAPRLTRPVIGQGQAPPQPMMARTQTQSAPAQPPPAAKIATVSSDPVLKATVDDLTQGMSPELKAIYAAGQKDAKDTADSILKNQEARREVLRQEQALKSPDPRDFPLQNYGTPPPNMPNIQPLQAFSGWGVALAMIGSLLTRRPLTAALNIGAAAMKSYTQARWQDYKVQHQIWQDSVDQAARQNELELKKYQMAWDNHANDLDKLDREMKNIALDNQDTMNIHLLNQGMYDEAFKLIAHREDLQAQYAMRRDMAAERQANALANRQARPLSVAETWSNLFLQNFMETHKRPPTAEEYAKGLHDAGLGPNAAANYNQNVAENIAQATHQDIQDAIGMIQASPLVVGGPGVVGRYFGITGWMSQDPSGAQLFQSKMIRIQSEIGRALKTRQITNADAARAQDMIRGLGTWDTPATAIRTLQDADQWLQTIRGKPWVYRTPEEAGQAFQNGEIDETEYRNILATQFNIH